MKYPHLFSPIKLGGVTFRNRIFSAPTGNSAIAPPDYLKREYAAFFELRAKGGAASVSLGEGVVHTPTGLHHPWKLRMDDPGIVPSLSNTARAIRQHGAVPTAELAHGGKYANVANLVSRDIIGSGNNLPAYGPSHEIAPNGTEIFEMPEDIINTIVDAYGKAAKRAKDCGFGMVIIHGGHGWLLHQFMSKATNRRTDAFGGSVENRARLSLMVLDSIRKAVGPSFPIEFRMSGAEFIKDGYDIDEGVRIAKLLAPKVNLLHISAGVHDDNDSCVITHPSMFQPRGCNVWLAERVKKEVDVPVATLGGLNDPAMMEEIIASGKADVVEMSRAITADPYLPLKALEGREDEIVKCIRCFLCLNQTWTMRNMRCSVNPVIGRELEHFQAFAPTTPKKVLVVGGGPAGMQAALTASQRGHDVTLCEASDRLGGQLKCEEYVPFKQDLYAFAQQQAANLARAGVKVMLNTKVDRAWAEAFKPDAVIATLGATHVVPPIPGIDSPKVKFLPELTKAEPDFGKRVVVLGGGLVGSETAVHLFDKGHDVTIVEMLDTYAPDATLWHKQGIDIQFRKGVKLRLSSKAVAITSEGVIIEDKNGKQETLPADTVFCAVGLRSCMEELNELRYVVPRFYTAGDCEQPGQVFQAVSGGHFAALDV